jgi:hypothetical protein
MTGLTRWWLSVSDRHFRAEREHAVALQTECDELRVRLAGVEAALAQWQTTAELAIEACNRGMTGADLYAFLAAMSDISTLKETP